MSARATASDEDDVRDDKRNEATLPAPTGTRGNKPFDRFRLPDYFQW